MAEPLPYPADPPISRTDLAPHGAGSLPTLWTRVGARLFDGLILAIPSLILALPHFVFNDGQLELNLPMWAQIATVVGPLLFEIVFLVFWGATPGKMLLGIRVVTYVGGQRPALHQVGVRVLLPNLGSVLGLAGVLGGLAGILSFIGPIMYFAAALDPLMRGLHDRAAGTIVLRTH